MTRDEAVKKVCVALDVPDSESACELVRRLRTHVGFFKIGMELHNAEGPSVIRTLTSLGAKIFLDLKFHDIPNTVAGASRVVAPLGVSIFNVHASGGIEMMRASLKAASDSTAKAGVPRPRIIAITVLTSIDDETLKTINQSEVSVSKQVEHLARMTKEAGLDGVVASPQEIRIIRSACGPNFLIVTPGVRPAGGDAGDQKRFATPAGAIQAGADILVIGRPITAAKDPVKAAEGILEEIQSVSVNISTTGH
jgi:orotidine-5'-phosphate decarboxylase